MKTIEEVKAYVENQIDLNGHTWDQFYLGHNNALEGILTFINGDSNEKC